VDNLPITLPEQDAIFNDVAEKVIQILVLKKLDPILIGQH
jgi:hypothetical protein